MSPNFLAMAMGVVYSEKSSSHLISMQNLIAVSRTVCAHVGSKIFGILGRRPLRCCMTDPLETRSSRHMSSNQTWSLEAKPYWHRYWSQKVRDAGASHPFDGDVADRVEICQMWLF